MNPHSDGSPVTELLFIRHGETDWNRLQRFQGHVDVALNDTGRAQARRLAARLAADRHDALFSSDLQRARETAAPLAAAWGRDDGVLPGFREQNFGLLEGLEQGPGGRDGRAQGGVTCRTIRGSAPQQIELPCQRLVLIP